MLDKKILKSAKKILNKGLNGVSGAMYYDPVKNLLVITDTYVLVQIEMPYIYEARFDRLERDIPIDYYAVSAMNELVWPIDCLEFNKFTLDPTTNNSWDSVFIADKEWNNLARDGSVYSFPLFTKLEKPQYEEQSLFWWDKTLTEKIWLSKSFETFQDVCTLLLTGEDGFPPIAEWKGDKFVADWDIDIGGYLSLHCIICVSKVKSDE